MTDTQEHFQDKPNIKKVVVEPANDNAGTGLPASPGFEIWTEEGDNFHTDTNTQSQPSDTPKAPETQPSRTSTKLVAPQMPKPTALSNPSQFRGTQPSSTKSTLDNASHRDEDYSTHVKRYFEDTGGMSAEDLNSMNTAFSNNMLNVQVTNSGKTYFNPEGVIYLADLLTVLAKLENFKPDYDSMELDPDAVSPKDYYLDGYLFIRNSIPHLCLDRTTLFRPVTLRLLDRMVTEYTDSKIVVSKLKNLGFNPDNKDLDKFISVISRAGVFELDKTADDLLTRVELSRFYNIFTSRKDD